MWEFVPGQSRYNNYNTILKQLFSNRVQKISILAGFTCPNRDGSKGVGGCTYCNNHTFVPDYCQPTKSIAQQINEGIHFFQRKEKYAQQKYMAYFQSYTNTYDRLEKLISIYEQALNHPRVSGIVVGTRPDCITEPLLDYFQSLSKHTYVMIEYGIESTDDNTLQLIRRGHSYQCAVDAIEATAQRGILTGAHLILGLPLESRETILQHADRINLLPLNMLKLHQLQIVSGTTMAEQRNSHPEWFTTYTAEEFIALVVEFLEKLSPRIGLERFVSQSPKKLLIAPDWGLKNFEFITKVEAYLESKNSWQGKHFQS